MNRHLMVRLFSTAFTAMIGCESACADQAGLDLLSLYRQVATDANPSVKSLAALSGWKSIYEQASSDKNMVYHVFTGSIQGRTVKFNAMTTLDGVPLRLWTFTSATPACIRRQDVLEIFGAKFERGFWLLENAQREIEPSDEVKQNLDLFSYGPRYEFHDNSTISSITVYFNLSACAEQISLQRVASQK
jgi:hypothetical protein